MRKSLLVLSCCLAMTLVGTTGFADSIGGPGDPPCGTCDGSIYTLTSHSIGTNQFQITFTVDTSGWTGGPSGSLLDDVAFKVSSAFPAPVTLVSAPNGAANWTVFAGGINAGGCSMAGSGFVCAAANSVAFAPVVPDGTLQWVFDVMTAGLFTGSMEADVKARYTNPTGTHHVGDLLSESITLQPDAVPEPSSALLFGLAVAVFGSFMVLRPRFPAL